MKKLLLLLVLVGTSTYSATTNVLSVISSNTFNQYVDVRVRKATNSPAAYDLVGLDSTGTNQEYKPVQVQSSAMAFPTAGKILNGVGSESFPSYSFLTNVSTGLYLKDTDSIGVSLGGVLQSWWVGTNFVTTNIIANSITASNYNFPGTLNPTVLQINSTNVSNPIVSGTYTPTILGIANTDSNPTASADFQYVQIGNIVQVSGNIAVDATAAGYTLTQFSITLPVARGANFADGYSASGSCILYSGTSALGGTGTVTSNSGSQVVICSYPSPYTASCAGTLTFTYKLN